MRAKLTPVELVKRLKRQTPEQHKAMKDATKVPPLAYERWLKDPEGDPLEEHHLENLALWVFGDFVHVSSQEGYIVMTPKPREDGQVMRMGKVQTERRQYADPTEASNVPLGMQVVRNALRGAEVPATGQAAIDAAKKREAAESAKARNPLKRVAEVMTLRHIHH